MRQERIIFQLRKEYVERLDQISERHGMSRSELIRDILMHYLGLLTQIPDPKEKPPVE